MENKALPWFSRISWCCLLGDGGTGLMLVLAPLFTLQHMGVHTPPAEPIFIRYIGIFVLSAGLFYLVPRFFVDPEPRRTAWKTVFICTTGLRLLVALFVASAWGMGLLETAWMNVSLYDAVLALVQSVILVGSIKK